MPISQLDTGAALIVIDLQKGVAGCPAAHPAGEIIARAARLARAFRKQGRPVVLVNVTGAAPGRTETARPRVAYPPDWTELVPELEQHPNDYLVSKQRPGAFIGTPLDDYLRGQGVTQVVLTGVATSSGVEATARSAYDLGYNVAFVTDAMTDMNGEAHRHSVEMIFPRLGETAKADEVLKLLSEE